jgi:hypothetical protein
MLISEFAISLMANSRFIRDDNNNVVLDTTTNLMWEDTSDKNDTSNNKLVEDAINACEALELGGYEDWHLPNINELRSLTNISNHYNDENYPTIFRYSIDEYYTTSTILSDVDDELYYCYVNLSSIENTSGVDISNGHTPGSLYCHPNTEPEPYRCVRSAY